MTQETEWRAELAGMGWWRVVAEDQVICSGVTEAQAKLIAAAPDVADALAWWLPIVRSTIADLLEEDARKASYIEGWEKVEATIAALAKAGRAPQ